MVDTIKFSQMTDGGDIDNDKKTPGLKAGGNVLFNNPWTFLPPGTTAERPTPSATVNYRLRFNTDEQLYEYYDAVLGTWTQLQESAFTQGPFITYTADPSLPDAQNLGALADGLLKQSITLGVATLDIAVNGTDYWAPGDALTRTQAPTVGDDVCNKTYVDALVGGAVTSLEGTANQVLVDGTSGTPQTGALVLTTPQDIAPTSSPTFAGLTMTGDIDLGGVARTINALDPVNPQDYATKFYVDQNALIGMSVYAATINTTMNATQAGAGVGATLTDASGTFAALSLDGVAIPLNADVLVKNTGTGVAAANEGIYKLTTNGDGISIPWQLTRSVEYDTPEQINNTGLIIVQNGSTLAGTVWYNTSLIVTVDTTAFSYTQFGGNFALKGANSDITSLTGITGVIQAPTFINDSAGLHVLGFGSVASAVNYVTMSNNSTGNPALIDATGSDGTVALNLRSKGNLFFLSPNNATGDAELRFFLANGTSYIGLKVPSAIGGNLTFTLPAADGSADQVVKTNGSATLGFGTLLATPATQAEQETATSTTAAVTPGRQKFHPAHPKAWVYYTSVTTTTINASFGVTSLTDGGSGTTTVNYTTSFSSTNNNVNYWCNDGTNRFFGIMGTNGIGSVSLKSTDFNGTLTDCVYNMVSVWGDI